MQADIALTESIIAGAVAGIGGPAILFFAAKGKLSEWFLPRTELVGLQAAADKEYADIREDINGARRSLEKDIKGERERHDAMMSLYNQLRADADTLRDKAIRMEESQNPVAQGISRMENKLDLYLERQEEHGRVLAIHGEQIKTLLRDRGRT